MTSQNIAKRKKTMDQPVNSLRAGTVGGTLLVIIIQVNFSQMLQTIVLASIGAATSFFVTKGLQWMMGRRKQY